MTIADRIKIKRMEKDLSQTELALLAGYNNKTAISKLEHAGDNISMKQIKRVAVALDVSPAFLMGWEDDSTKIKVEALGRMFPDKVKIIKDGKPVKLESPDERHTKEVFDAYEYRLALENMSEEEKQQVYNIERDLVKLTPANRTLILNLIQSLQSDS